MKWPTLILFLTLLLGYPTSGSSDTWVRYGDGHGITDADIISYLILDYPPQDTRSLLAKEKESLAREEELGEGLADILERMASNAIISRDQRAENLISDNQYAAIARAFLSRAQETFAMALRREVKVSEEDIEAYYAEHQDEFALPEERTVRYLFVRQEAFEKERLIALIEEIKAAVDSGTDFEQLVEQYSQVPDVQWGGLAGPFTKQSKEYEFVAAAFRLRRIGDVSPLLYFANGYYWIQLLKVESGRIAELDSVQEKIQRTLFRRKFEQARRDILQAWKSAHPAKWSLQAQNLEAQDGEAVVLRVGELSFTKGQFEAWRQRQGKQGGQPQAALESLLEDCVVLELSEEGRASYEQLAYLRRGFQLALEEEAAKQWLRRELAGTIEVEEAEMKAYFAEHRQYFRKPRRFLTQKIATRLPSSDAASPEEMKRSANAASSRIEALHDQIAGAGGYHEFLKKNPDFFEDHPGFSLEDKIIGDTDSRSWFHQQLAPLLPGQTTEVKHTYKESYFLVYLDTLQEEPMSFQEARARIKSLLEANRFEEAAKAYRKQVLTDCGFELVNTP